MFGLVIFPKYFIKLSYSLPWNQKSWFGYIGEITVDVIIFTVALTIFGQLFLLFISICVHFFTFTEMFESFVNELDSLTEEKKKTDSFRKLIEFHVDIKRCVKIETKNPCIFY